MSAWKRYDWFEFPEGELPWAPASEIQVMPDRPRTEEFDAEAVFDPRSTYFSELTQDWGDHPVGSRVLITPTVIAIELPEGTPGRNFSVFTSASQGESESESY
jgi:hypothetical protein